MWSMVKHVQHSGILALLLAGMLGMTGTTLALEIGEQAPDFTLPSTTGEDIRLSQFRGKQNVLLEFYINDFGAT